MRATTCFDAHPVGETFVVTQFMRDSFRPVVDPHVQRTVRAELLERGGRELWDRLMDELRETHLGIGRPAGAPSVLAELRAAYDAAVAVTTA